MAREKTNAVIKLCEDGGLSWEVLAKAALSYMSEDDVADLANQYDFLSDEELERETEEPELKSNKSNIMNKIDGTKYCVIFKNKYDNVFLNRTESYRNLQQAKMRVMSIVSDCSTYAPLLNNQIEKIEIEFENKIVYSVIWDDDEGSWNISLAS